MCDPGHQSGASDLPGCGTLPQGPHMVPGLEWECGDLSCLSRVWVLSRPEASPCEET